MPDVKSLAHFVTIMQTRSFKDAAEQLDVSQSSMTRSIAQLEDDLNLRLFNRTTRTVEPTDSARALSQAAGDVLKALSSLEEEARLIAAGDLGTLRVDAIALASETLLADALAELARSHPALQVEVVVGAADVYSDLIRGECDVVIGDQANLAESPYAAQLRRTSLQKDPIVLVHRESHPYQSDFRSLVQQPLAIPSRYYNENHLFNQFRERGGPIEPRYRLNSLSSCIALTQQSDVVTLAPASLADRDYPGLHFCKGRREDLGIEIDLALVSLASHSPTPAMRVFHQALLNSIHGRNG